GGRPSFGTTEVEAMSRAHSPLRCPGRKVFSGRPGSGRVARVVSPYPKYIYVGCDSRDAAWTSYHHHADTDDRRRRQLHDARTGTVLQVPAARLDAPVTFSTGW